MEKKLNTVLEYEFQDGDKAEMTLTFYKLYQLKSKRKDLYERYTQLMAKKSNDDLEMVEILYTAYACAHIDNLDSIMSEEEFMIKCGSDRRGINQILAQLIYPKK